MLSFVEIERVGIPIFFLDTMNVIIYNVCVCIYLYIHMFVINIAQKREYRINKMNIFTL